MNHYAPKVLTAAIISSTLFIHQPVMAFEQINADQNCTVGVCQTEGVNFQANKTLTVNTDINIGNTGGISVTTDTASTGTIFIDGSDTDITGQVGTATNPILLLRVDGMALNVTDLQGDVFADTINLEDLGLIRLEDNVDLNGVITNTNPNKGSIIFNGSSNIANTIGVGGGGPLASISLQGPGTVTLNAVTKAASGINVGGGSTLKIMDNVDVTGNNLDVLAGGTLEIGAAGKTITGPLENSGTVDVGPNKVTVTGQYNQKMGSTFNVTINPDGTMGQLDAIALGAVIDGDSTVNVSVDGVHPNGNTKNIITDGIGALTVPGTVTGGSATYAFTLADAGGNIALTVNRTPLTTTTSGSEQVGGVAGSLEAASADPNTPLLPLISLVEAQPNLAGVEDVLTVVSPISDGSLMAVSQNNVAQGISTAGHRMEHLRLVANNPGYVAGDHLTHNSATWLQFFGTSLDQDSRNSVAGFDGWNAGFALGVDTHVMSNLLLGMGFSYAYSDIESKFRTSNELNIHTFQGFVYGTWEPMDDWYVDGIISAAFHDYDTTRHIVIAPIGAVPGLNLRADGEHGAWQLTVSAEGGYDWRIDDWLVTPHASLKYSNLNVRTLQESGAGPFNLRINYDDVEELVVGAGLRLGYLTQLENDVVFHPHIYGQVFHDFINDRQQSTSNFFGGGTAFVTPGLRPDDTSFRVGAGVNLMHADDWTLTLNYDYEFKDDYDAHGGFLKFRKEWA